MAKAGVFTKKYVPIMRDTFNIVSRIKQIDSSYFILFNKLSGLFEVHSSEQRGGSFCLELPFSCLDARALTYARKYRTERAKEIFAQMEKENEILEKRRKAEEKDFAEEVRRRLNDSIRNDRSIGALA